MIWRVFSSDFDHCDLRVSLSDHFYSSNELLINYNACHLCDEMFMITLVEIFFFRFSLELSGLLEWFLQFRVGLIVHKTWYKLFQLLGRFSSLFSMNFFFVFRSPSWNFFPIFSDLLDLRSQGGFDHLSLEFLFKISVGFNVCFKSLLNLKYYFSLVGR